MVTHFSVKAIGEGVALVAVPCTFIRIKTFITITRESSITFTCIRTKRVRTSSVWTTFMFSVTAFVIIHTCWGIIGHIIVILNKTGGAFTVERAIKIFTFLVSLAVVTPKLTFINIKTWSGQAFRRMKL